MQTTNARVKMMLLRFLVGATILFLTIPSITDDAGAPHPPVEVWEGSSSIALVLTGTVIARQEFGRDRDVLSAGVTGGRFLATSLKQTVGVLSQCRFGTEVAAA